MFRNKKLVGGSFVGISCGISYLYSKYGNKDKYYTYQEVKKHNNLNDGIWVTYKDNVYDITNFIENHPGGKDKILLSAGKSLEPYWNVYKQHTNNPYIINEILKPM